MTYGSGDAVISSALAADDLTAGGADVFLDFLDIQLRQDIVVAYRLFR